MYYVIDEYRRCYDKSVSDTFGNQVTADCTLDLSFPNNVVEVRNVTIACAQGGNKTGKIFIDHTSANHLQLDITKTFPNAIF